jgi:uncharacterized protein (DUF433 family)
MGNFYTNYTLRGPSQEAVAAALAERSAIVTPAQDGCVVVFDEASDDQDQKVITKLASQLSRDLRCPVLAVLNHDDDIFWYQLYLSGKLADEYDSSPGYFDASAEPSAPSGGDAQKLCTAFGAASFAEVESILRKSSLDDGGYTFAVERHADLVRSLGIPDFAVGAGFRSFSDGELPEGLGEDSIVRIGQSSPAQGTSQVDYRDHITIDPKVRNGVPCIRGLPIAVSEIVDYLAADMETEQIIAKHPELTNADIVACVAYFIRQQGFPKI